MITLHHLDQSRSQRIVWLLEELELPYEIKFYSRDPETRRAPPELTGVHPLGKSPVITDGDLTLAESGLIAEYLCDRYGDGRLAPAKSAGVNSPERMNWSYWLHYSEGSLMAPLLLKLILQPVDEPALEPVRTGFIDYQLSQHLRFCDTRLAETGWFAGDDFSAADLMMSFPLEASSMFGLLGEYQHCQALLERLHARPAYQLAIEKGTKTS